MGTMCVVVSRPMKIVTFHRKDGDPSKLVVDFLLERDTFRNKIMEIVEDFEEKSYNNNGKPWKSSRILHLKPNCFIFFIFFIYVHFFFLIDLFFPFPPFFLSFSFFLFLFSFFAEAIEHYTTKPPRSVTTTCATTPPSVATYVRAGSRSILTVHPCPYEGRLWVAHRDQKTPQE